LDTVHVHRARHWCVDYATKKRRRGCIMLTPWEKFERVLLLIIFIVLIADLFHWRPWCRYYKHNLTQRPLSCILNLVKSET
jgi:hypothetical protein